MRSLLLGLLALALSGCCGTLVQGEVRTLDHMPVEGARISVDETGNVRYTDANGRYVLALPCRPEQPYLVRVLANGFPEIADYVNAPGGHTSRNFVLGGDEAQPASPRDTGAPPPRDTGAPPPPASYDDDDDDAAPPPPPPVRRDPPPPARRDPPPSRVQSASTGKSPCPQCGTEVPRSDTHCPSCGTRYYHEKPARRAPPRRSDPPARRDPPRRADPPARADPPSGTQSAGGTSDKTCPACGMSVPKGVNDCSGCGGTVLD